MEKKKKTISLNILHYSPQLPCSVFLFRSLIKSAFVEVWSVPHLPRLQIHKYA